MESMLRAPVRGYARALLGTVALALAVALVPIAVLILVTVGAGEAQAQTKCSAESLTDLTVQAPIDTTEPPDSMNALETDLDGVKIITMDDTRGVHLTHEGDGDTKITVKNSCIKTAGDAISENPTEEFIAAGVLGQSVTTTDPMTNVGDVTIDVQDSTIVTTGADAKGIAGVHNNEGNVDIDVEDSTIETQGNDGDGIFGRTKNGQLDVDVTDVNITTDGILASGVSAVVFHGGDSDVTITVGGGEIITNNITSGNMDPDRDSLGVQRRSHGIDVDHQGVSGSLTIVARDEFRIETRGNYARGVYALRRFSENESDGFTIDLENGEITTLGDQGQAVYGLLEHGSGTSNLNIMLEDVDINTAGTSAHGILGWHKGTGNTGNVDIDVRGGTITTNGLVAYGVYGLHEGNGKLTIDVRNAAITTESVELDPTYFDTYSLGIQGLHQGTGDIDIDVRGGSITTRGVNSYGIYGRHDGDGDITIDTRDGHTIMTTGEGGHGIVAHHGGTMDSRSMAITVGGTVDASGEGAQGVRVGRLNADGAPERDAAIGADGYRQQTVRVNGSVTSAAEGVYLAGGGRVIIGSRGVITSGNGIAILATGTVPEVPEDTSDPNNVVPAVPAIPPKLRVDLNLGGRRVAQALGETGWIINDDGETTIAMNGTVLHDGGVTGRTAPNGAWNVKMREEGVTVTDRTTDPWGKTEPALDVVADRDFSGEDFTRRRRPTPPPPSEPEPSVHRVNEPIFGGPGEAAGVLLDGGGEVYIGAEGTIGAESGIAILATGVEAPMLHVDLMLDGRRVMDVIGDDWIINDGGETTIVVNNVKLHDGETGVVPDAVAPNAGGTGGITRTRGLARSVPAPNGAFDVRIREEGVTVMDRSDPDPANWVITEPAAGVVADRDFSAEDFIETPTRMFTEEYAPRAALYELLPDFLLRLMGPGPNRRCGSTPDSSVWTRVAGGQGAYESDRSTTGATYDLERFEAEGGLSASLGERAKGWVSVRHVTGSAGVASPTGGGAIDVRGLGSTVGGSWRGANDVYAVGCFSYMAYDVDFASTQQGVLKAGVDGQSYTLDLEAGRRYAVGAQWHLTPRVWVVGSRVSVDDFTDAVDARVSLSGADRVLGGLGVLAETARPWGEGEFSLRGSLDFERMFSGAATTTQVSGEQLSADATDNSLLVGLQGVYRLGRFTVGAEVAARQELGSTDSEYTSFLNVGLYF